MMPEHILDSIAKNLVATYFLMFCLTPSKGDSTEIKNDGPYRIYTTQAKIPDGTVLDTEKLYQKLVEYLEQVNDLITAPAKFYPHHIETYHCPCGCGDYLYVSLYTY